MLISLFDSESGQQKPMDNDAPVRRISVILAKPTKACNADCSYCFAKPYDKNRWTIERFKAYFDKIEPYLLEPVQWIWHGGEPMLMGVDFFRQAETYAKSSGLDIVFSMQSNLTMYNESKWLSYVKGDIGSRISSSYDIDEVCRTINGDQDKYNSRFFESVHALMRQKISPFVIGVYDDTNIELVDKMYDLSKSFQSQYGVGLDFRVNPKIDSSGKTFDEAFKLSPKLYGEKMASVLERWITDPDANFIVTPLNSFISFYYNYGDNSTCPWTNKCAGSFLNIEPNGDVYNCDDMVHYNGFTMKYGNLMKDSMSEILTSSALTKLTRRISEIDPICVTCEYYHACRGGCGAMTLLSGKVGNGRYPYCETNRIIFGKIKALDAGGYRDVMRKKVNIANS